MSSDHGALSSLEVRFFFQSRLINSISLILEADEVQLTSLAWGQEETSVSLPAEEQPGFVIYFSCAIKAPQHSKVLTSECGDST